MKDINADAPWAWYAECLSTVCGPLGRLNVLDVSPYGSQGLVSMIGPRRGFTINPPPGDVPWDPAAAAAALPPVTMDLVFIADVYPRVGPDRWFDLKMWVKELSPRFLVIGSTGTDLGGSNRNALRDSALQWPGADYELVVARVDILAERQVVGARRRE